METLTINILKESARNASVPPKTTTIKINDTDYEIEVSQYLSSANKAELVDWVISFALDSVTGIISPMRLDVMLNLAIVKFYSNIILSDLDLEGPAELYDILFINGVFNAIVDAIPSEEYRYILNLMNSTVESFEKYATSMAGALQTMASQTNEMDTTLTDMLEKIKNKEGIEELSAIRKINGD